MPVLDQRLEEFPPSLLQGDVLKTSVHFSDALTGKPAIALHCEFGLVVSRDCTAEHKGHVLVAPVSHWKEAPRPKRENFSEVEFDKFVKTLSAVRDGGSQPDRFVLGSLNGSDAILVARFDEISTLTVPRDRDAFQKWVRSSRVARLSPEFRRALPTRLFWALCRGTFDDHSWFCTSDLRGLVAYGEAILKVKPESESLREKLEPYRQELDRRIRSGLDATDG